MKRLALCIVLAAFAALTVVPAASAKAVSLTRPEKQLLALVNHVRVQHGLPRVAAVATLERAARAHSREMVRRDYFSHSSFNGQSFMTRLMRFGYSTSGCRSWSVCEDIAYGWQASGTPQAIFSAWMHSPPHRAVILTKSFRNVGIGRAQGTFKGISDIVIYTLDCGARTSL